MTDPITQLIDDYCAAWNEPDPGKRFDLMMSLWTSDATYTDPGVHVTSVRELVDHISRVRARRPGALVRRTSNVDTHHNIARFSFEVATPDETVLLSGLDVADLASDGARLNRIIGFFDA